MWTDSIHAILPIPNQSAIFVGVVFGFLNVWPEGHACTIRLVASA